MADASMTFRFQSTVNTYPASSVAGASTGFFDRVVVITTTLIRTHAVPRIVRSPSASPAIKYPIITATTGFTYAYVPTVVGDS
jgi:hypothetical protein